MKKKALSLMIIVAILMSGIVPTNAVLLDSDKVTTMYEENVMNSNGMVFRFWDYYTDYDTEICNFPDYFGGFEMEDDGTLTMYITDSSDAIKMSIYEICQSDDMKLVGVNHSFNELRAIREEMVKKLDNDEFDSMYLDLSENSVVIEMSAEQIRDVDGVLNEIVCVRESSNDACESETLAVNEKNDNEKTINDTDSYTFYPGQSTSFNNGESVGTIGFCATDSSGRRLLITHAHGYEFDELFDTKSVTVGGLSLLAYSMNDTSVNAEQPEYDAAYIILPNSALPGNPQITLSNKVNNLEATKLHSVAYDIHLESYNGCAVSAFGASTGFMTGVVSNLGYRTDEDDPNKKIWNIQTTLNSQNGDSGGPIYLTGPNEYNGSTISNNNRLIGIIRSGTGDTLWQNIRDKYREVTGFTLSAFAPVV